MFHLQLTENVPSRSFAPEQPSHFILAPSRRHDLFRLLPRGFIRAFQQILIEALGIFLPFFVPGFLGLVLLTLGLRHGHARLDH